MENMMKIGADLSKDTADNAANAIKTVLEAGFHNHVSEQVLLKALDTLRSAVTVQNITVDSCTFDNSTVKEVNVSVPADYSLNV